MDRIVISILPRLRILWIELAMKAVRLLTELGVDLRLRPGRLMGTRILSHTQYITPIYETDGTHRVLLLIMKHS